MQSFLFRVMSLALGRSEAEEYAENLFQVSKLLRDQRGLLFTNKTEEEVIIVTSYSKFDAPWIDSIHFLFLPYFQVLEFFEHHEAPDFHRTGSRATLTVTLPGGPLPQFPHSLEPQLRQLGLPTALKKGVVQLLGEEGHTVCREGDSLTSEQARLLKLLGHQDAKFRLDLVGGSNPREQHVSLTLPLTFFFCRLNMIAVWDKSNGEFSMLRGDAGNGSRDEEDGDAVSE